MVLNEDPGLMLPAYEVFKRDLAAVEASNTIVAEVTWPSRARSILPWYADHSPQEMRCYSLSDACRNTWSNGS